MGAVVTGTLAASLFLVERQVREYVEVRTVSQLRRDMESFQRRDVERGMALQLMASSLAASPAWDPLLGRQDWPKLAQGLRESVQSYQIAWVLDAQGRPLLRSDLVDPASGDGELAALPFVKHSLKGESGHGYGWFAGGLWRLASVPLQTPEFQGSLTVGYRIDQTLVELAAREADCDVALFRDGKLLGLNERCRLPGPQLAHTLAVTLKPGGPMEFTTRDAAHQYRGLAFPLGDTVRFSAWLVLVQDNADAIQLVSQARRSLGILGGLSLLGAVLISIPVVGRVAQPAEVMETVFQTVGDGLVHFDRQGQLLKVNSAARELLLIEEGGNHNFFDRVRLANAERQAFSRQALEATLKDGSFRCEDGWLESGTQGFPASYVLAPVLQEGQWTGSVLSFRDNRQIREMQRQLLDLSHQAGMAEVATGTLHNVGNALNSVNVSAGVIREKLRHSRTDSLRKAASLLDRSGPELVEFLTQDPKGQKVPGLVLKLARGAEEQQAEVLRELENLTGCVEHVKQVIKSQQAFTRTTGLLEWLALDRILEEALSISLAAHPLNGLEVVRDWQGTLETQSEKHKLLQILVNLCGNALQSLEASSQPVKRLGLRIRGGGGEGFRIEVEDNGLGIAEEHLDKLFTHGFTTKTDGHGFGLHNSSLAARNLGGKLEATSPGPGLGACFTLTLPASPQTT